MRSSALAALLILAAVVLGVHGTRVLGPVADASVRVRESASEAGPTASADEPMQSGEGEAAATSPTHVPRRPLRVATKRVEPFVMETGGRLTGFSIDLLKEIALTADLPFEWVVYESVPQLIEAVESGETDLAIAAISMTPDREQLVDFSYPYYQSGLQVVARSVPLALPRRLANVLLSQRLLFAYLFVVMMLVLVGHVVWLGERGKNPQFPRSYVRGVWEGIWWAGVTVTTVGYGDRTTITTAARLVAMVWMFFGLFLMANFTAVVTTELAVQRQAMVVRGPDDLAGTLVAAVEGTTSADYLVDRGIEFRAVTTVDEALDLLRQGDVDAVVHDLPVLQYHLDQLDDPELQLAGEVFQPEEYAIALPTNSPYREELNAAMLEVKVNGTYDELMRRWSLGPDWGE